MFAFAASEPDYAQLGAVEVYAAGRQALEHRDQVIYDQVKAGGPESLPQIGPLATYITLAPFLGAQEACAVANGD